MLILLKKEKKKAMKEELKQQCYEEWNVDKLATDIEDFSLLFQL